MVILSDDPVGIDPMKINSIVVLEAIKDGKSVYTRQPSAGGQYHEDGIPYHEMWRPTTTITI
jgi:hypothetical protein